MQEKHLNVKVSYQSNYLDIIFGKFWMFNTETPRSPIFVHLQSNFRKLDGKDCTCTRLMRNTYLQWSMKCNIPDFCVFFQNLQKKNEIKNHTKYSFNEYNICIRNVYNQVILFERFWCYILTNDKREELSI